MNSWLWPTLIPEILDREDDTRLIGVGSLLSRNLDLVPGKKVIFGTGSGYSDMPTHAQASNWNIYCVRGPLTAHHMGLDPALGITDAAWLINQIPEYSALPTDRKGTVFVPHWTSAKFGNWDPVCKAADVNYVDPLWDCARVFSDIANAELALVESLHGAIIADYYRTPWIPIVSPNRILKFKWLDWCGSLGLDYQPYSLPPSDYVDCLMQRMSPKSIETTLEQIEVPKDTYDVKKTAPPPQKAGAAYIAKRMVKKRLRNLRNSGLDSMTGMRNGMVFRNWNEKHTDHMVSYFNTLKAQPTHLSAPDIRDAKIEGLNTALEKLKDDFKAGRV